MLDSYARKYVQPVIEHGAKTLHHMGLSANTATWIAMLFGVSSAILLVLNFPLWAVIILWCSGIMDVIDGTIARLSKSTPWGNILDISFDRIVEASMIIALLIIHPEAYLSLALCLAAILLVVTVFLVAGNVVSNTGIKGFHYNPGLLERTEAFAFFTLMMLLPSYIDWISWLFFILLMFTAVKHLLDIRRWLIKKQ